MKSFFALLFFVAALSAVYGQETVATANSSVPVHADATDTASQIRSAGLQYAASGWKKMWWGEHYRNEWVTPVSFPVLKVSAAYGGLQPLKTGGGHQTKTLRLLSGDGKEYILRTIDKSLDVLVPDYLKGTFVNDMVNDQISTAHPYGPVAISRLADAIHIPHTHPRIYYVLDDPALGEFRDVFANKLCLLEERPSGKGWEFTEEFANADKIINTEDLFEKVFSSTKNRVDQQAFLKVRLFDMVINDWDRHEDQWIWALKKSEDQNLYIPIGRDRDQAFSKTDGIGLYFLSMPWAFRPLKNFKPTIKDVKGLNFAARNLDQQFLNQLNKQDWERTINSIQYDLTDTAIQRAVRTMPGEVNHFSGETIIKRLKQRRADLARSGMNYYDALSERVTVNGSSKDETFVINLDDENEAAVTGLNRASGDTFYHRVFHRNETREINLYGLEGNDQFVLKDNARNRFVVRLIGGEGNNEYQSETNKFSGKKMRVYDSLSLENISQGVFKVNRQWDSLYRYKRQSVKYDWFLPLIIPGYNVDDGFTIGLGLLYRKQKWGKSPFGWEQQFVVNYATGTSAVGFEYAGLFKNTFGKWDFDLNAYFKGPRYTFFYYGLGNETKLNSHDRHFYRVKANDFYGSPGLSRAWRSNYLRFGLQYEAVEILKNQNKFITTSQSKIDSGIFSLQHFAGVNGNWTFFNAGQHRYPTNGFRLTSGFSYMNNLDITDRRFLKLYAAATIYHTFFKKLTLAHRTGGATNLGDFDFYHANSLGLDHDLRGFWKSRFTGKSAFYQNTEARFALTNLKGYYLRGILGVFSFMDDGRVWIEDEHSSKLHVSYGGGIYFLPYNLAAINLFYSSSKEINMVTLRTRFFF